MQKPSTKEVIAKYIRIFFQNVLRKGEVVHIQDVCEIIRPDVEAVMRRSTKNREWKMRADFLFNTLRILKSETHGVSLAFCGNAVWLMEEPSVNKRLNQPKRRNGPKR
jgi:hypothetical protein